MVLRCHELSAWHIAALIAGSLGLAPWEVAQADEGGVPFWLSGASASFAAVPASPGWSLTATPYYTNGSAPGGKPFPRGSLLVTGYRSLSPVLSVQPGYAPDVKVAGGQPYVGLGFGYGRNNAQADLFLSGPGIAVIKSDSLWGWSDLAPVASVAWTRDVHNWMTYLTGNVPVGTYDSTRLAAIGIGHAAIDGGAGYTYLNPDSGHEFTTVVGLTYNWKNGSTDYKNGVDSHLDWGASQSLSPNWYVGVVGYIYYQLTNDSYPTGGVLGALKAQALGGFKSRIAAVGPQLGYSFKINGQDASLNLRGYSEFWAQNRTDGYALFATLSIPLGSASK
jgi:hypothetical protein